MTCISIIVVVLPIDTEGSTSPSSNCTSNTTLKSNWRKEEYPNPKTDIAQCGRNCKSSSICDPGHAISIKKADELDTLIDKIAASGTCKCANCTGTYGYIISIAVVPSIDTSTQTNNITAAQDFVRFLSVAWNTQQCDNYVIILLSTGDKKVYTDVGSITQDILTQECIKEVDDKVESDLSKSKYYDVLMEIITQYKIILSTGNCDYISNDKKLTRAAIISGSIYGLVVILFVLLAIVHLRKEKRSYDVSQHEGKHDGHHPNEQKYHKNNSFDELVEDNDVEIYIDDNQSRGEI